MLTYFAPLLRYCKKSFRAALTPREFYYENDFTVDKTAAPSGSRLAAPVPLIPALERWRSVRHAEAMPSIVIHVHRSKRPPRGVPLDEQA
jgi:hypothetical protein